MRGALARCAKAVADVDIDVLSGFDTVNSSSRVGYFSFFAVVTDTRSDLKALEKKLKSLSVVEGVEVLRADDGFMVDGQHFPLRMSNRRALILRTEALTGMISRLWEVFGSGAATILDQMAESMGRFTAQELLEDLGEEFVVSALDEVLQTYTALGYAQVRVTRDESDDSLIVHARELFECEANALKRLKLKSIFFLGHMRGFVSTIFQANFEVTEMQCVAEGEEACTFCVARIERVLPQIPLRSGEDLL